MLCAQFASGDVTDMNATVRTAAREALEKFKDKGLTELQLAVTVMDLSDPSRPPAGSFRGDVPIYPASVVKLFYLAAAHRWMEDGKLPDSDELRGEMRKMIVDSSNQSTGYVIDAITGTTSGDELPEDELKVWAGKRNAINKYFASLGYEKINVNQKTWEQSPYGRDKQFLGGAKFTNRNALTTDATARLMSEIVTGKCVSTERSRQMMELLQRDMSDAKKKDGQATDFTGRALTPQDKLWSKAGWTSTTRHDVAYVETTDGLKFVIAIFTVDHANQREIIPTIVRSVMSQMRKAKE